VGGRSGAETAEVEGSEGVTGVHGRHARRKMNLIFQMYLKGCYYFCLNKY